MRHDELKEDLEALKDTGSIISAFTTFTEQLFLWDRGGGEARPRDFGEILHDRLEQLIHDHERR